VDKEDEECSGDVEASIQREVASVGNKEGPAKLFTPIYLSLPCVLFFKTRPPVEPVDLVHRICVDAMKQPANRKHRFVNRLTPITVTGKATEKGLEEVGRAVLRTHFRLADEEYDRKEIVDAEQRNFSVSRSASRLDVWCRSLFSCDLMRGGFN
jgi:tRNA acetyltransferase TAN1